MEKLQNFDGIEKLWNIDRNFIEFIIYRHLVNLTFDSYLKVCFSVIVYAIGLKCLAFNKFMPEKFDRVLMEFREKEKIWKFDRTFMEKKKQQSFVTYGDLIEF